MSKTVDERVVSMQFDNAQFERNVSTSMSTLDKLKQSLKLNDAAKGLDNINNAASKFNLSGMGECVETVKAKFSALEVMAVTALANITNSAVNAGKNLVSAFTIEPIKSGFQEYETQINAVQTVLANTESKGTTLKDVNAALDELNVYADKTIYNFTEMTRNIGTFTAAGIGLKESTSAIQGIANLAAVSGSNSQQASTAMYQLSQALAAGTVKLQDWNSVVNAGMGGQVFQDALKKTARSHGIAVDEMIEKNGSFRESLQEGWITSDILTETLSKMTKSGAAEYLSELTGISQDQITKTQEAVAANKDGSKSYDELAAKMAETGKVSKEDALEILKMADTAENAATKVKTFTQLMDTLKEAAQSGWTQSWEIIIGDFEEAKELWTEASDYFSEAIGKSAEARNKLLEAWADGGGRTMAIDSIKNVFEGLLSVIKPIKEAFRDIFPATTAERLLSITSSIEKFTSKLKLSKERASEVKDTFKGVFSVVSMFGKVLGAVGKGILDLLGSKGVSSVADMFFGLTSSVGRFLTQMNEGFNKDGLSGIISKMTSGISDLLSAFGSKLPSAGKGFVKVLNTIWNAIEKVFSFVTKNVSISDIFAGLAGGGIFVAAKKFSDLINTIKDSIEGLFSGDKEPSKISEVLDSLHDSLESFSTGIKVASVVSIAVAVGILSASLRSISGISAVDIGKSLGTMGAMMALLNQSLKSITKTLSSYDSKGLIKAGVALVLLSTSIKILSSALKKISELSLGELAKGLSGITIMLIELVASLKFIDGVKIKVSTSIAMLALAESCKILADALAKFGALSWEEIKRGLAAMGGALGEFVAVLAVLQKAGGFKTLVSSVALLVAVQALDKIAEALKSFGSMSWEEIKRGLAAMGGALGELVTAIGVLGKVAGFSSLFGAGAILIVVQGLGDLSNALMSFGSMSWEEIKRGLTAMGGALAEVAVICGTLGKIGGFSSLFGAGAILIVVQGLGDLSNALISFGLMSWEEIGRGLVAMGGALAEVAVACGALGTIAGFSSLFGAGAILIVVQGLGDLASALEKFGSMSWSEIGRGLVAMGAAMTEVAVVTGALGWVGGLAGLVGAGTLLLAIQGLNDLATALEKFGSMSWEEIGRGLTAMGAAMTDVAFGGLVNTFSGFGASAISEVAEPLGALADSVKKWADVTVPEELGSQLASLAAGVMSFTFGGLGASAISEVAEPLGTMAGSISKWAGITVPEELGSQLASLASGVKSFTFGGFGASAISEVAEPLGIMAGSISKWAGVTVPEDLGTQLSSLASGVKSFTFGGFGASAISEVAEPLGTLANSIKKWNGVDIPENLTEDLTSLADGVKSFSFAFLGGWSIDTITGPLGDLASAVKKWNGVKIPSEISDDLKDFGEAVMNFANKIWSISGFNSEGLSSFATAISKLNTSVQKIGSVDAGKIDSFVSSIEKLGKVKINTSSLTSSASAVSNAINRMMKSINTTISGSKSSISSSMAKAMSGAVSGVKSAGGKIKSSANEIIKAFTSNISSKKSSVTNAFNTLVSGASNAIKNNKSSFNSAGKYLGDGLVEGIKSKETAAYNAGFALGQKAVQGEKDGQKSQSPSKLTIQAGKWLGEGLVIGIDSMGRKVYNAGYSMGDNAAKSMSNAISKIKDSIDSDIDTTPTIRPVLDLSNVKAGTASLNNMLSVSSSVGIAGNISAINSMMNRRNQNGTTEDVVSAIKDLKNTMSNVSGNSYTIEGITYGDGTDVANAIETLVRAATIERRV